MSSTPIAAKTRSKAKVKPIDHVQLPVTMKKKEARNLSPPPTLADDEDDQGEYIRVRETGVSPLSNSFPTTNDTSNNNTSENIGQESASDFNQSFKSVACFLNNLQLGEYIELFNKEKICMKILVWS